MEIALFVLGVAAILFVTGLIWGFIASEYSGYVVPNWVLALLMIGVLLILIAMSVLSIIQFGGWVHGSLN